MQDNMEIENGNYDNAMMRLYYSKENGHQLSCNKDGLKYLKHMIEELEKDDSGQGHIHLFSGEFPMEGRSYSLIIWHDTEEWFEKHANRDPGKCE